MSIQLWLKDKKVEEFRAQDSYISLLDELQLKTSEI